MSTLMSSDEPIAKVQKLENKCSECARLFQNYSVLRRHVKRFHPDKINELCPLKRSQKTYPFKCFCGKNFTYRFNYARHLKIHENEPDFIQKCAHPIPKQKKCRKCPLCSYESVYKTEMYSHFEEQHSISIHPQDVQFKNIAEFENWQREKEEQAKTKFVKERGTITRENNAIINYVCYRSGFYKSGGKGMRNLKAQGSNKINGFCPAGMKVIIRDSMVLVRFVEQHVGHSQDISRLRLTSLERKVIADKLADNVPMSQILDEIRDEVAGESRLHLLTKKDLYNIQAANNLQNKLDDGNNLDEWVSEVLQKQSVTFYKPAEKNYPELAFDDYVLCIMNEGQCEILKKNGNNFICIDFIESQSNFVLFTLFTEDNLKQAFPCAFIISNRTNEAILKACLRSIKEQMGVALQPKIFMSDVNEMYYNAWKSVMEEADERFFCTWHVDNDWRNNLKLIRSTQKQAQIYKTLRLFLEQSNPESFNEMLTEFIIQTDSDPATSDFNKYFQENYLNNVGQWANCFRLGSNTHIERVHMTIKFMYLGGKKAKRLDRAITALMKFVQNKLYETQLFMNKGWFGRKLLDIRSKHKSSLNMSLDTLEENENGWQIKTIKNEYGLYRNDVECGCELRCEDCNCCVHQYSCSCMDCSIKWNMCKHIHLLCRFLNENTIEKLDELDENMELTENELLDTEISNSQIVFKELPGDSIEPHVESPKKQNVEELIQERTSLRQYINQIIDNISTHEELEILKKMVGSLEAELFNPDISFLS